MSMTLEQAAKLRAPFSADVVGKLPRVWCGQCREATKNNRRPSACQSHTVAKCRVCGNKVTDGHLHLDYVGHAETTDRLLSVDPGWTWEPVAFTPEGLPFIDVMGGLWIRLTVCGVTRLGYGHAGDKRGPDAVKEAIGDALRNSAMRFGVALDLWGAKFKEPDGLGEPTASELRTEIANVGMTRGMDPASIAADFEAWTQGGHIGVTEDVRLLAEYLDQFKNAPAGPPVVQEAAP
jgi:hypothetical protein